MFSFAKKLVDRLDGSAARDTYFGATLAANNAGYGLRVLRVEPHLAAQNLGFEAWFDYIVGVNHHDLPMTYPLLLLYAIADDGSVSLDAAAEQASMVNFDFLAQELAQIAQSPAPSVVFDVWSAKGGVVRQVHVLLRAPGAETAPDSGTVPLYANSFASIGLVVQSQHVNTATYVWKILSTHAGLPAFQAQLIPYLDYIVGCDLAFPSDVHGKGLLAKGGEHLLSRTVVLYYNHHYATLQEDSIPIVLYVYNHDYDVLRPVTVHLSRSWTPGANKGILGCDVGYGLLHRLPESVRHPEPPTAPAALQPPVQPPAPPAAVPPTAVQPVQPAQPAQPVQPEESPVSVPFVADKAEADTVTAADTDDTADKAAGTAAAEPVAEIVGASAGESSAVTEESTGPITDIVDPATLAQPLEQPPTSLEPAALTVPTEIPAAVSADVPIDAFAEISLEEPHNPPAAAAYSFAQTSPIAPPAPAENSFVPHASPTAPPPSFVPLAALAASPKAQKKKRSHAPTKVSLTDFMNEELSRSKANDVKFAESSGDSPPPPPPPKSVKH